MQKKHIGWLHLFLDTKYFCIYFFVFCLFFWLLHSLWLLVYNRLGHIVSEAFHFTWASGLLFFSYILHAYCSRAGVVQFPLWASYWFHYLAKQDNFFVPCYQLFTLLLRVDWQCREISSTSGIWMAWPRKTKNRNTKVAKGQAMSWFQPEKLDWILKIQPVVPQLEESKTLRAWP